MKFSAFPTVHICPLCHCHSLNLKGTEEARDVWRTVSAVPEGAEPRCRTEAAQLRHAWAAGKHACYTSRLFPSV